MHVMERGRDLHRPLLAWRYRRRMEHLVLRGNFLPMERKVSGALMKAWGVSGRTKSIGD